MQIIVDGLATRYELTGKGKLVVLLHGWGDNLQGLQGLRDMLGSQYQILAIDLPGFGGTQVPGDIWGLDEYAQFVAAVIEKLKLKQPYAIVGHSHGGAVTVRGIGQGILTADKLVLIAPSGIRAKQSARRLVLKMFAKVGNIATIGLPEQYRRRLRASLYHAAGSDLLVVPQLESTFKKTVRQDVQEDAARITVPTLLLFGSKDQAVPLDDGQTYHRLIKGSKLEILEAGHFVHLDQPEAVVTAVKGFLS